MKKKDLSLVGSGRLSRKCICRELDISDTRDKDNILLQQQIHSLQEEVVLLKAVNKQLKAEVTQLNAENEKLVQFGIRDALTGVYNRAFFEVESEKIIANEVRCKRSWALLTLDLDDFKKCNDTYGHDAGDAVLKNVAQMLEHISRDGDFVVRMGGDEFCIFLLNVSLDNIKHIAERYRKAIFSTSTKHEKYTISVTPSIGACFVPHDSTMTLDSIAVRADKALYDAKSKGRNCIVIDRRKTTR